MQKPTGALGVRFARGNQHPPAQHGRVGVDHGRAGVVGVAVQTDALVAHVIADQGQGHTGSALVVLTANFVVRDHHRDIQRAADFKGFMQGREDVVALVTHVGGVERLSSRQGAPHFNQLGHGRMAGRRVERAAGHANCTRLQGLFQQVLHAGDFIRRGRAVQR